MIFCAKCGAPNDNNNYKCARCGEFLQGRIVKSNREHSAGMRMLMPVGRSEWAIAAGYAGLFGFTVFLAPIALVLGIVAMFDLKRNPDKHGWGRAIFGTLVGVLGTGLLIAIALMGVWD